MALPRSILIVRLSHMGDVVQTLPLFHALRRRFPDARLGWAIQSEYADLVRGLPGLERAIAFDRRGGFGAWLRLRSELRDFGAELSIDAQANLKSAFAAWFSSARERLAPHPSDWREHAASRLANRFAPRLANDEQHAMHRVLELARTACGPFEPEHGPALTETERAEGRAIVDGFGFADGPLAIVQLGPLGDVRTPTDELVRAFTAELVSRGFGVVLTSGARDAERLAALREGLPPSAVVAERCGHERLRTLASWLSACAERRGVFISADTGPMHLAAACGMPCVALIGPTDHFRTGPWPPPGTMDSPHRVVRAGTPVDCSPCRARTCHRVGGRVCLERIEASHVADAVCDALAARRT